MRSFKEGVNFIKETKDEAITEAMMALYSPTKKQKTMMGAGIGAGTALGMIVPVMAAGEGLQTAINNLLNDAFAWLFGITTALAALLILIAFVQYMVASDPQTSSMAKNRIIKIVLVWVAINCIGGIITALKSLTEGNGMQYNG